MRISRIYHPHPLPTDNHVILTDDASHYVANVLRAKVDQPIVLFNGDGNEYDDGVGTKMEMGMGLRTEIKSRIRIGMNMKMKWTCG